MPSRDLARFAGLHHMDQAFVSDIHITCMQACLACVSERHQDQLARQTDGQSTFTWLKIVQQAENYIL
jgi:hypothetical protein